ncbi:MAG: N-acetylmuramoyl-L-alanine amidase [Alphaproteobacteria bacterium]|nr:N-acetylmuramoyl-L-alanine amidase [Alphaproteobacteria bacterium]
MATALALLLVCGSAAASEPAVTGVRLGLDPPSTTKGTTRVVLDLTNSVPYSAFLLGSPYRLVIDLPEVAWSADGGSKQETVGLVERLRYGHFRPGNSRVVVDLMGPAKIIRHSVLTKPDRIVFDIAPVGPARFAPGQKVGIDGWEPPNLAAMPLPKQKPGNVTGKRVVVIDAGHGGVDPGAVRGRTYEKRITLAIANAVKSQLEKSGRYRVVMTRSRDVFLELRERVEVAHANKGDIFISLHADTHPKGATRGASVYTLSQKASDAEAAALAAKENNADVIAGTPIDTAAYSDETIDILRDLQRRQTDRHSVVFARMLTGQLGKKGVALAQRKAHRFAGFVVLKSPNVPSVLVELGYLSNKDDRQMLQTPAFRSMVAKAMLASVDQYFKYVDDLARR